MPKVNSKRTTESEKNFPFFDRSDIVYRGLYACIACSDASAVNRARTFNQFTTGLSPTI
jgi:hypothetical protein